jgi:hypothetical protein
MEQEIPPEVRDIELVRAAQCVGDYEITGYGTVRTMARNLGLGEAERLLGETLRNEQEADQILTKIGEKIGATSNCRRERKEACSVAPDDLRAEVLRFLPNGEQWLELPNTQLQGRRPSELIGTPEELRVRQLLNEIMYLAVS